MGAAAVACVGLAPSLAHAQWWRSAPSDFEECADLAEKAKSKEDKTSALADCNAKFAGRRKPGGGYTYYDFMQDKSFDIAGPNPTPEEQRKIDEQYTRYLEKHRRESIANAMAAKQEQVQQISLRSEPDVPSEPVLPAQSEKVAAPAPVPLPVAKPKMQAAGDARPRPPRHCVRGSFSCEWPRLSQTLDDLKKLFNPPAPKPKRG